MPNIKIPVNRTLAGLKNARESASGYSRQMSYLCKGGYQFRVHSPACREREFVSHIFGEHGNKLIDFGMGLSFIAPEYGNKRTAEAPYNTMLEGVSLLKKALERGR